MTLCATSVDLCVSVVKLWAITQNQPQSHRGRTENLSGKILSQCHGPQNHNIAPALDLSKV